MKFFEENFARHDLFQRVSHRTNYPPPPPGDTRAGPKFSERMVDQGGWLALLGHAGLVPGILSNRDATLLFKAVGGVRCGGMDFAMLGEAIR